MVLNVLGVLGIVFLVGFNKMALPQPLLITLIAETTAQAAAIFLIITRFLFSSQLPGPEPAQRPRL
jgi:hypothetical protein